MEEFLSPFGIIELTDERELHIFTFHPEVRKFRGYFKDALFRPDTIRKSKHDSQVIIFYISINKNKFLAIVIKQSLSRNFVLTAYITERIQFL